MFSDVLASPTKKPTMKIAQPQIKEDNKHTAKESKPDFSSAAAYILANTQPKPLHIGEEYLQDNESEDFILGPQPGSTISDPYFNPEKPRTKPEKKKKGISYELGTGAINSPPTPPSTAFPSREQMTFNQFDQPPAISQQPTILQQPFFHHPLIFPQQAIPRQQAIYPQHQQPILPQQAIPLQQPIYPQHQQPIHQPHIHPLSQQPPLFSQHSQPIPSMPSRISTIPQEQITAAKNSQHTKLLLLIALCSKQGSISMDEKGKLKDLVISGSPVLLSALEVFEIDQDLEELVDTLRRICKFL